MEPRSTRIDGSVRILERKENGVMVSGGREGITKAWRSSKSEERGLGVVCKDTTNR